ncbi:sigma 54 modulation/S30EA ribosomal C-terminal domain-containing protein, partial [Kibdelosporangium lantanae]
VTLNVHPVPRLTTDQAVERLNATELPHRFFQDEATRRGAVLYRRYDGDYGLITPYIPSGRTEEE